MKKLLATAAFTALAAVPMASHAVVYQFNAMLSPANEVRPGLPAVASSATGIATLFYDTADNTFDFTMSVFNLTSPATGYHIHGAASTTENAPVRIALDAAPFTGVNLTGGTLLVGGSNVAAPTLIPATPASSTNAGYPAMSMLDMLQNGLAYVNVHTVNYAPGELRGQLMPVIAVPEPGTYALMVAGLAAVGWTARRRSARRQETAPA